MMAAIATFAWDCPLCDWDGGAGHATCVGESAADVAETLTTQIRFHYKLHHADADAPRVVPLNLVLPGVPLSERPRPGSVQ